jgi:uncharacterized protein
MIKTSCRKGLVISIFFTIFTATANAAPVFNQGAGQYVEAVDAAIDGNYRSAYSKWMPLAKQGNARAQFNLALLYHGGLYVKFNEDQAVFWYQQAAENGIREAQEYLAVGYKEGWFGLPVNKKKADYWQNKLDQAGF